MFRFLREFGLVIVSLALMVGAMVHCKLTMKNSEIKRKSQGAVWRVEARQTHARLNPKLISMVASAEEITRVIAVINGQSNGTISK